MGKCKYSSSWIYREWVKKIEIDNPYKKRLNILNMLEKQKFVIDFMEHGN